MKYLTIMFVFCSVLTSCAQQLTSKHIQQKKYEGYVFPKEYSSKLLDFKYLTERFTPSESDIEKAEATLSAQIKAINQPLLNQIGSCPVIDKNLSRYKRQYVGYVNQNGDKIIWINFVGGKEIKNSGKLSQNIIIVLDGCSNYWNIKVNLSKVSLYDFYINGSS